MYENKKILVLGAGKSGISVAKILASKNDVTLSDVNKLDEKVTNDLENLGIKIIITDNQLDLIDKTYDLIVKNPAIKYTSNLVKKINELEINLENEMEVAYHYLPKDITIIGVTGSNGKTTTTTIIYEILKASDKPVVLGGNIGYALCEVLPKVKSGDILLLEISDHQLCDFKDFKTNISVLTNISKTHLDYHGTYEHYKNMKGKIFNNHTSNDLAIINKANIDALDVSKNINSKKEYFNDSINYIKDGKIYLDNKVVLDTLDIKIKGNHNYENILAALLVVKEFNVNINIIKEVLKSFNGVEHRLEYVATINGVEYYNDSKSTNPESTITALKTFTKPLHLILGGENRNQDFSVLNPYLKFVKHIYAVGEVTDYVYNYAMDLNISCDKCYTLKSAMEKIKENVLSGDVVLLSPGSSSQDQYPHFEDRGIEFKKYLEKL